MKQFWKALSFVFVSLSVSAQSPPGINFVTTDVEAFWKYFDEFRKDTTQNPFIQYLDSGTHVLKEFIPYWIVDAQSLKKRVQSEMAYYEQVRPAIVNFDTLKPKVAEYVTRLQSIYPGTTIPDVYFIVGRITGGGSANDNALVIGAEMYADTSVATSSGFKSMKVADLPEMILHCLIYYNQKPAHIGYNVMRQSIVAGSAQFIATLISEKEKTGVWQKENFKYGEAHEELLAREFLRRKYDSKLDGWLYNWPSEERPADLGIWMGYKITAAYYDNATDKQKAIVDIMQLNDFEQFIALSGYLDQFQHN